MTNHLIKTLLLVSSALVVGVANAHSVEGGGFINGLMHPVFGVDHLLAMVAVGVLSTQMGGKSIWTVPLAFVAVMLVGGIWGMLSLPFPAVETGIALSVLALGVAIALDKKLPMWWAMLFVGFFAAFHGYAHGQEMPDLAQPELYASGFIVATISLHITGVVFGEVGKRIKNGASVLRYVGAGVAGMGFSILVGL